MVEGTRIRASVDALPGQVFEGEVTAIEPQVDANTRNFKVRPPAEPDARCAWRFREGRLRPRRRPATWW